MIFIGVTENDYTMHCNGKREKRQTNYSITRGIQNSNNIKYIDDILMLRIIRCHMMLRDAEAVSQ